MNFVSTKVVPRSCSTASCIKCATTDLALCIPSKVSPNNYCLFFSYPPPVYIVSSIIFAALHVSRSIFAPNSLSPFCIAKRSFWRQVAISARSSLDISCMHSSSFPDSSLCCGERKEPSARQVVFSWLYFVLYEYPCACSESKKQHQRYINSFCESSSELNNPTVLLFVYFIIPALVFILIFLFDLFVGKPTGYDRVRNAEIGNKVLQLFYFVNSVNFWDDVTRTVFNVLGLRFLSGKQTRTLRSGTRRLLERGGW